MGCAGRHEGVREFASRKNSRYSTQYYLRTQTHEKHTTKTQTAADDLSDAPNDPRSLTPAQASKGAQFFFRSQDGYVEAEYAEYLNKGFRVKAYN